MTSTCFAAVKQNQNRSKSTEGKLRSLVSLNQGEYDVLLSTFDTLIKKKLAYYTLKGQMRLFPIDEEPTNSSLYGSKAKLDFILMYLKENPNQSYHGKMFDICQSKVSEWISYLLPVLEESLRKIKVMPQTGFHYEYSNNHADYLLVDVTEREVVRDIDSDNQREFYSGKKKKHTMKNLAITDQNAYIEFISESYMGSVHDKTIYDQIHFDFKDLNLLADLGFVGIDQSHANAILPFKKPKGKELSALKKEINRTIGAARVRIEHAFSGVKRLKIIRNKIRLKSYQVRDQVFRIAVALHNLRVSNRALQNHS